METSVPDTSEGGSHAAESHRFSSDESLQFKLETLAYLGEISEDFEKTLTVTTGAVFLHKRAEDSNKKTTPRSTEVAVGVQLETAVEGVTSYSTNLSSLPPNGVWSWFCGIPAAFGCNTTACSEWFWFAECGRNKIQVLHREPFKNCCCTPVYQQTSVYRNFSYWLLDVLSSCIRGNSPEEENQCLLLCNSRKRR